MSDSDGELFFPEITLPPKETDLVCELYSKANVVLEYGSGGSTIIGAECDNISLLMSVESDKEWVEKLQTTISSLYPLRNIKLHHADIGPTKNWGMPKKRQSDEVFRGYSESIWVQDYFEHPDLILIDGRFRVGCFYAALLNIQRPVTILWDDYAWRMRQQVAEAYHVVEKYIKPVDIVGRMARFEVTPNLLPKDDLPEIMRAMILPR